MQVGPSLALYRRLYLARPRPVVPPPPTRPLGGTLARREGRRRLSQRKRRDEDSGSGRLDTAPDEGGREDTGSPRED